MKRYSINSTIFETISFFILALACVATLIIINVFNVSNIGCNLMLIWAIALLFIGFIYCLVLTSIKYYARGGKNAYGTVIDLYKIRGRGIGYRIVVKYMNEYNENCSFYDRISKDLYNKLEKGDMIPIRVRKSFAAYIPSELKRIK